MKEGAFSTTIDLGDKIHITDPCYEHGTWCGLYDLPAKPGKWICTVEVQLRGPLGMIGAFPNQHPCIIALVAHHEAHQDLLKRDADEKRTITVDSGCVGIFDASIYPSKGNRDARAFFRETTRSLVDDDVSIIEKGFVSSSGGGDGTYDAHLYRTDGAVCAISIQFLERSLAEIR